jgi:hypothetical protein
MGEKFLGVLTCDDALRVSNDTVAGQEAGQSHSSSSHLTTNLCNNKVPYLYITQSHFGCLYPNPEPQHNFSIVKNSSTFGT